jgi:transposase-like protein
MSSKRYPEEFKIEAVKRVTERGHSAPDVAKRLGVSQPTLYEWIKRYGLPEAADQPLLFASNKGARASRLRRWARRCSNQVRSRQGHSCVVANYCRHYY